MGRNTPSNANGKETLPLQHRSRTSGKGGSSFGQLSCGRRILASKYQRSGRPTTSTSSVWRENHTQSRTEVHLKEIIGMRVGKGVLESKMKTGDDVAGLVLFSHHIAVQVMEVYACGGHESTEDGQVLRDCIGKIVRWSSSFVEPIDMVPGGTRSKTSTSEAFDFNEDNPLKETIISRNMVDCEELDEFQSLDPSGTEENMENAQTTCSISRVDGLPSNLQKKKYTMTERVRKKKQQQRIGSSREEKVSLANVQHDMQSSICSKGCMKKLDAGAVLMKRFRAWGSHEYEVRASWILENLTDSYNKEKDKFETRLCGVFICNGCYAVALGYSKRRIEELKSDIRSIGITSEVFGVECSGRSSAVHGNTVHVPRTSVGVQAMESVFEKYVTKTGCTQPPQTVSTKKRQSDGTIDIIAHEYKTRGCVSHSCCKCREDHKKQSPETIFILPFVAHGVYTCTNSSTFSILEMPNLLGVSNMLGSEYHESSAETISTGKVKSSSSSTSGGEEGLLESQTECNIVSERINVSDCRWNGPKYDYGAKAMTSSERN